MNPWLPRLAGLLTAALLTLPTLGRAGQTPREATRSARFAVRNAVRLPDLPRRARSVRIWLALPREERQQRMWDLRVTAPGEYGVHHSERNGNRYLYVEVKRPRTPSLEVVTEYAVERDEVRSRLLPTPAARLAGLDRSLFAFSLKPSTYVVISDEIRAIARRVAGGEPTVVGKAHKLYDWVLNNIEYWVKDPKHLKASGIGSSEYCLRTKSGNCTDFHSLYAALARSQGIPVRMVYGSLFKPELDGVDKDGSYHCWVEFYNPGAGWTPLDVALADLQESPAKQQYYFGNLDERRVAWTIGRDLTLAPQQAGGPVNSLPKAYVEVNGKPYTNWTRKFTYRSLK